MSRSAHLGLALGGGAVHGAAHIGVLRSLAIHHNLALVTSSRQELVELCHSDEVRTSPFFNIFANIGLRGFSLDQVRQLRDHSLEGTGVAFTDRERESLIQMSGWIGS